MAQATQVRHPRGIPTGGRFASSSHSEGGVELDAPTGLTVSDDDVLRYAQQAVSSSTRNLRSATPADVDDMVQELATQYIARRQRVMAAWENGEDLADGSQILLANPGAYMQVMSKGIVQVHLTGMDQSSDRGALKEYLERRSAAEQTLRRHLTDTECDELANDVRQRQPPQRRAKQGFHHGPTRPPASWTSGDEAGGIAGLDGSEWGAGGVSELDFDEGSRAAAVMASVGAGTAAARADARRNAWNAVAEMRNAPEVAAQSMTESEAAQCRVAIKNCGGAVAVARMWSAETAESAADVEGCRALFKPFANADDFESQARIANTVIDLGHCDGLHDSAIAAATIPRADRQPSS